MVSGEASVRAAARDGRLYVPFVVASGTQRGARSPIGHMPGGYPGRSGAKTIRATMSVTRHSFVWLPLQGFRVCRTRACLGQQKAGSHTMNEPENQPNTGTNESGVESDSKVASSRASQDDEGTYVGRTGSDDDFDAEESGAEARSQDSQTDG